MRVSDIASFFNPIVSHSSSLTSSHGGHSLLTIRHILYHETWWQIALLPLRIFFEGADGNPRLFDGKLNPFLLLLPLLAFFARQEDSKKRWELKLLAVFSILYFLFAFLSTSLRIRYIASIIPPLVVLSMFGLKNFISLIERKAPVSTLIPYFFPILAIAILLPNYFYLYKEFKIIKPLQYINGHIDREKYLIQHRPDYLTKKFANTHLPKNAILLCLFIGGRGYYLERPHLFAEPFNDSFIVKDMRDKPLISILDSFQHKGITHILAQDNLMIDTINHLANENEKRKWYVLFKKHTTLSFTANGYSLYKILSSP